MSKDIIKISDTFTFKHVTLDEEFRKKWNERSLDDFYYMYINDKKVSNILYRMGGMFNVNYNEKYIIILQHTKAFYDDSITTKIENKPHLESHWCIIDKQKGHIKKIFKQFDSPYLIGGVVYSINNEYYNIETGKLYCRAYNSFKTENYILLDKYNDSENQKGVMKINKNTGEFEMII